MTQSRWFLVISPDGAARTAALHTANAFRSLIGADRCKAFDCATYRQAFENLLKKTDPAMVVDLLNQSLALSCLDFQATHCLVAALSPVTLFTLQLLRKHGVKTVHWFYEDYRKATYWKSVMTGYDHFFAVQRGAVETTCGGHGVHYHFLPTAAGCGNPEYASSQRPYDGVFIGIPSTYRITVLETLSGKNLRLAIAGSGWNVYRGSLQPMIVDGAWIDDDAAFRLMQQSKTGLNLSFDNPAGRTDRQVSPRVFDLLAAGCLLVSETNPLLDESLPGCSLHTFRTIGEAAAVITALLENYQEHSPEIERNRTIVLQNHQYINRVGAILRETGGA
ncbi:MAG: glycosyltransferase family 1 protein [Chitinispirillaceae bacterium]|nr:glycosyltransferase family 1 protein [Chitinispirillaceae bacterium]